MTMTHVQLAYKRNTKNNASPNGLSTSYFTIPSINSYLFCSKL